MEEDEYKRDLSFMAERGKLLITLLAHFICINLPPLLSLSLDEDCETDEFVELLRRNIFFLTVFAGMFNIIS